MADISGWCEGGCGLRGGSFAGQNHVTVLMRALDSHVTVLMHATVSHVTVLLSQVCRLSNVHVFEGNLMNTYQHTIIPNYMSIVF